MAISFAIKDILHHMGEFKGNFKVVLIANVLANVFINIMSGLLLN